MKGMELSERYFREIGSLMIEEKFPEYKERIAAGLVGEGSECFGYDDEVSRDHDWGPAFCLWLNGDDFRRIGAQLQTEYDRLPKEFLGFPARKEEVPSAGRVGVFDIGGFYMRFLGTDSPPENVMDWRRIPEEFLAVATNGRVFSDPLGEFSAFRKSLLRFYPEDVRLKKLAARCAAAAQGGQYNYERSVKRGEMVAAHCAMTQFLAAATSIVFLLNRRYKPFYKWMHRMLSELPVLGEECQALMAELVLETSETERDACRYRVGMIEKICAGIILELRAQNLSDSGSDFLLDHAASIQSRIKEPRLREMPIMAE